MKIVLFWKDGTISLMSLYRKYRPLTFVDVVGQEHIVLTLENAIKQDKVSHAYLFAGSRGTGKTSMARILAKQLMIKNVSDEAVKKQIIKGVEEGSIVDLLEIDGATSRQIDDVRDLIEKIQFSPVVSGAKVYIIDEVHMLTKEAFNALLKTLEEPPAYAYFILATTELYKVPSTIQSRCQCYPFRRIREEDIIRRLQFIADHERIVIEREAVRAIAHHVSGSLRDAISLLDQLHSLGKITLEDVEQRLGGTGLQQVEKVFEALEKKDRQALIETVISVEETGVAMDVFLRQLLTVLRQNLHEAVAQKKSVDFYLWQIDELLQAMRDIRIAPVPGLIAESVLLNICGGPESISLKKDLPEKTKEQPAEKKSAEAEKQGEKIKDKTKTPGPDYEKTEKEDARMPKTIEVPELSLQAIKDYWPEIITKVPSASVKTSLKDGEVTALSEGNLELRFISEFHRGKVAEISASRQVEEVLEKVFKKHLKIKCLIQQQEETAEEDIVNLAEAAGEVFS